jgi:hypothetical protein
LRLLSSKEIDELILELDAVVGGEQRDRSARR